LQEDFEISRDHCTALRAASRDVFSAVVLAQPHGTLSYHIRLFQSHDSLHHNIELTILFSVHICKVNLAADGTGA